jgi:hypothetical protein
MNTLQAAQLGIPRWMVLAMPEDVEQIVYLAHLEYRTPAQRREARKWYLKELRRTQWDRVPRRKHNKPDCLKPSACDRPSRARSGYRTNIEAHKSTRLQMEPQRRAEIARKGAQARWHRDENSSSRS